MSTLPTTSVCYQRRIADLQLQIQALLEQVRGRHCSPREVEMIDQRMQPLYAAIWAMHAETCL